MNNFTNTKQLLTEGYGEALPLWLKSIAKAFPEMKIDHVEDDEYVVLWKNKPVAAASYEDGKIQMAPITDSAEVKNHIKKLKIKKFQKEEDVRKYIFAVIHKEK